VVKHSLFFFAVELCKVMYVEVALANGLNDGFVDVVIAGENIGGSAICGDAFPSPRTVLYMAGGGK
jgi:hypothetical protein